MVLFSLHRALGAIAVALAVLAPAAHATERGTLLDSPAPSVISLSAQQLQERIGANDVGRAILAVAGSPRCGVVVHALRYATVGGAGEPTTATGALMLPQGDAAPCAGPRPAIAYGHGTSTRRNYNFANLSDTPEAALVAAIYAAQGYIVVAPNYAGYDASTLPYHPYLNAEQQSGEMIDALLAALQALPGTGAQISGQLLVAGYSQGGHVAMATHRALQRLGVPVVASAPMSGPYALSVFVDALFYGWATPGATLFTPLLTTSYQRAYGDLYAQASDLYDSRYATTIETLLPSTQSTSALFDAGLLPRTALFSSTPPGPELAVITPPGDLPGYASASAQSFGADALIRNEVRRAYLQDFVAHPDGLLSVPPNTAPPVAPAHPLRRALKANDLRNWTPTRPVLLCGGNEDSTVYFELNTRVMERYWSSPSPAAMAPGLLTVLDVDSSLDGWSDRFRTIKLAFGLFKGLADTQVSDTELASAYHAGLVPPFCMVAARNFFDDALASAP